MKARLTFCLILLFAFAGRLATAQSSPAAYAVNRITAPIDESNRVPLPGNVFPLAGTGFDRGPAPLSEPTGRITLVLQRSSAQQQALTQYLSDVQNPGSPSYHKWLTPAQYGAQFGISDADLQTVEAWLQSQGFKIEQVPPGRNFVQFSGTFAQVQAAFQTSIHSFAINGEAHYANVTNPQIPAALAPVVAGVGPLNDVRPQPNLKMGGTGRWDPATQSIQPELTLQGNSGPLLFVDPADAATIYDTPNRNLNANYTSGNSWDGTGVNIGIVGDSNITLQDITNYRTAFLGETAASANLPTIVVDGNDPGVNSDGVEALLDNEIAGGLAPKAKIYFYTSAGSDLSDGLFDAVLRAIDDNTVSIVSISFGSCEAVEGASGNLFLLETARQAAAQGISMTVSAGDGGSAGCDDFDTETRATQGFGVNAIASTPYTIAVGGTDYDVLPGSFSTYANATSIGSAPYYRTAKSYIPEEPWNDSTSQNGAIAQNVASRDSNGNTNIVAGSGGVSTVYTKPAFQSGLTPADGARDLPDISLLAANGYYSVAWTLCSDSVADGSIGTAYTDCQNNNGQFTASTQFEGVGGTSAAAPAFAGILALVEQSQGGARLGQADYVLYRLAQSKPAAFHDITTGNNSVVCAAGSPNCGTNGFLSGYAAGTGYDLATGLGSVDVAQLVNNWSSATLTSTSTTFQINGSSGAYTGVHGASVNFAVGVSPAPSSTGEVAAITDTANQTSGGTSAGPQTDGQFTIPLASGSGSSSWNGLPGGSYTVAARYGGDVSSAASTSSAINVVISAEASTTTLSVNAYNALTGTGVASSSIPYGSYVFTDAQITGTAEGSNTQGAATGTVAFFNGATSLGSGTVGSGNQASWPALNDSFSVLSPGSYDVTARYSGDASFNASNSSAVPFTVVAAATSTTAAASLGSISGTQSSIVTVTVSTPENLGTMPGGSATLTANGSTVGTVSNFSGSVHGTGSSATWVLTGQASVYAGSLAAGTNTITVSYSGNADYAASSTTVSISDTNGVGSFSMSNSGSLSLVAGESAPSTVTVTPAGGFVNSVALTCVASAPVTCSPSTSSVNVTGSSPVSASFTVSAPFGAAPGTYSVTVQGTDSTGKITGSTSWNVTVASIPANAAITLTNSGALSVPPGSSSSAATITVAPVNGYIGVVDLSCAVTTILGSPASPPTCSVPASVTITGTSPVTAALTVNTTADSSLGAYTVTVTGTDANSAAITGSTAVPLTLQETQAIVLANGGGITILPGATTGNTSAITVTPSGGFTGTVNLACSVTTTIVKPDGFPTCSIPASVAISGTTAATATLTVNTTASTTGALASPLRRFFLGGADATLAMVLFFGIPARRRAWRTLFSLLAVIVVASATGCGGGSSSTGGTGTVGTTAGPYSVTVTGTDAATGAITATTTVSVMIN